VFTGAVLAGATLAARTAGVFGAMELWSGAVIRKADGWRIPVGTARPTPVPTMRSRHVSTASGDAGVERVREGTAAAVSVEVLIIGLLLSRSVLRAREVRRRWV
jgi:hypothetical protein